MKASDVRHMTPDQMNEELERLPQDADLPGAAAFKLYDTYGFPLDLTQDALREKGRAVDTAGFDAAMNEQKAKARAAWSGTGEAKDLAVWFDLAEQFGATEFLGYDTETAEAQVVAIITDGKLSDSLPEGASGWVMVNQTPFYGEAGGQVGDSGTIRSLADHKVEGQVTDTQRFGAGRIFGHFVKATAGALRKGDAVALRVDHARRTAIRSNHSATHLLHEALREELGDHVAQRGSLNAPDRLRFDFSHSRGLTAQELATVQAAVNGFIRQNSPVETRIMTPDDARAIGAQALFGEKYGDEVRVVSMGRAPTGKGLDKETWSIELCGGTHVRRTGDIGLCVVLGDSASSAGVRRIEALTGQAALDHLGGQGARLAEIADLLKTGAADAVDRVRALAEERKALANEVAQLRRELAMAGGAGQGGAAAKDVGGRKFLAQVLQGVSGRDLPTLIDAHKAQLGSGAILLIADADGKAAVAAGVTDDLTADLSAVDMVKAAVAELGGKGGGGRPDMAQGGGPDAGNAAAAIAAAEKVVGG